MRFDSAKRLADMILQRDCRETGTTGETDIRNEHDLETV